MLELLNNVAEKPIRKLLICAVRELNKSLSEERVAEFKARCSTPPFQELPEAVERVQLFVKAAGTIAMVDGLNDVAAVSELMQYKGPGIFERNIKALLTVEEPKPEGVLSKEAAAKAQIRMESRSFWRDAAADVMKTSATSLIQAPKLQLCMSKMESSDSCSLADMLMVWTELPAIRAGLRKGSCKAADSRLAELAEYHADKIVSSEAGAGEVLSSEIAMLVQVPSCVGLLLWLILLPGILRSPRLSLGLGLGLGPALQPY